MFENSPDYWDFSTSGSENGDTKDDDIDSTLANIFEAQRTADNSREFFRAFLFIL